MTNRLDTRRKRILFRSVRRGTKESDAILGGFAEAYLGALSDRELAALEALLERNDQDILSWVAGTRSPPPEIDPGIVDRIAVFKRSLAPS